MRGLKTLAVTALCSLAPGAHAALPFEDLLKTALGGLLGVKALTSTTPATSSGYGTVQQTTTDPVASVLTTAESLLSGLASQVVGIVNTQQAKATTDLAAIQSAANGTVQAVGYTLDQAGNQVASAAAVVGDKASTLFGEVISIIKGEYNAFQSVVDQLGSVYDSFFSEFCTAPTFTPSAWVPATFSGPGFTLTLSGGNATVDEQAFILSDGGFNFSGPSILFEETPAKFVSKYKSAPAFAGETCSLSKGFGDTTSQVLYVFDPTSDLNSNDIVGYLLKQAAGVLGLSSVSPVGVSYSPAATPPTPAVAATSLKDAAEKLLSALGVVAPATSAAPATYTPAAPVTPSSYTPAAPVVPAAAAAAATTTPPSVPATVTQPIVPAAVTVSATAPAVNPGTSVPVVGSG